jgi:hypothetical protein
VVPAVTEQQPPLQPDDGGALILLTESPTPPRRPPGCPRTLCAGPTTHPAARSACTRARACPTTSASPPSCRQSFRWAPPACALVKAGPPAVRSRASPIVTQARHLISLYCLHPRARAQYKDGGWVPTSCGLVPCFLARAYAAAPPSMHPPFLLQTALTRDVVGLLGLTPGNDFLAQFLSRASATAGAPVPAGCVVRASRRRAPPSAAAVACLYAQKAQSPGASRECAGGACGAPPRRWRGSGFCPSPAVSPPAAPLTRPVAARVSVYGRPPSFLWKSMVVPVKCWTTVRWSATRRPYR